MRKLIPVFVLAIVFATGFAVGFDTAPAQAIGGGGFTNCFYTCSCEGTAIRCCVTPFGVLCSPDTSGIFQCPQVYTC